MPPKNGPMLQPIRTAVCIMPSVNELLWRGTTLATNATLAAMVPVKAPCARRQASNWPMLCT